MGLINRVKEDPSMRSVPCDMCGKIQPLKYMKSIMVGYAMPGLRTEDWGYGAYACPNEQHFGCTHEHAMLAALCCLYEHILEGEHEAKGEELTHPILVKLKADLAALVIEEGGDPAHVLEEEAHDGTSAAPIATNNRDQAAQS